MSTLSVTQTDLRMDKAALLQALAEAGADVSRPNAICCPFHDDSDPSAGVYEADAVWRYKCHGCDAGGDVFDIRARVSGRPLVDELKAAKPTAAPKVRRREAATYDYTTADRRLLFQVVRYEPKDFRQRRPDGAGGWIWKLGDIPRVLFKLPMITAADADSMIFVCEGEKDVERIVSEGGIATTCPQGAGKWDKCDLTPLHGHHVVLLPDNDDKGREHAQGMAAALDGKAASVRVLELGDLQLKGDVSDWFDAGGDLESLVMLAEAAPEWEAAPVAMPGGPDMAQTDKPILLLPGPETEIIEAAPMFADAFASIGGYTRFGLPARVRGRTIETIEPVKLCSQFEEGGDLRIKETVWTKHGSGYEPVVKMTPRRCSIEIASKIAACDRFVETLPPIRVLAHCAVILPEGRIITGYDAETGVYALGTMGEPVTVETAVNDLLGLLIDWKFQTPADRARFVAAMLTPAMVYGDLLNGARCPAIGLEADQSQAGKGHAVNFVAAIYGTNPHTIAQKRGGVGGIEEAISGGLIAGAPFINADNLRNKLDCPFFEAVQTESHIEARVAYKRGLIVEPGRTVFSWTSNKAEMSIDMANRSNIVRIEKQPDEYRFKAWPDGPDLLTHVRTHQPHYLACIHAVLTEWLRRGRPAGPDPRRHDFHKWAGGVSWIATELFGLTDPLEGHRAVQRRIANQSENWLRDVAIAVKQAGQLGQWLQAHSLIDLLEDSEVSIPGMRRDDDLSDDGTRQKVLLSVGRRMGKFFRKSDTAEADTFNVERRRTVSDGSLREVWAYRFEAISTNAHQ